MSTTDVVRPTGDCGFDPEQLGINPEQMKGIALAIARQNLRSGLQEPQDEVYFGLTQDYFAALQDFYYDKLVHETVEFHDFSRDTMLTELGIIVPEEVFDYEGYIGAGSLFDGLLVDDSAKALQERGDSPIYRAFSNSILNVIQDARLQLRPDQV